jgi:tetratricopeptide (TPR) repeat protein
MAEAWLLIGDKKNASRLVDAALKEDPKNVSALVSRTALGSGAEARGDIEKALGIDANYARAYVWRAALRDSNDPEFNEKTIADLTRAVELEPYSISIRSRRAAIYLAAKDYKKAASDFTRITELEPLKANWWLELANASFLAGDRTAARRYFVAAIRVDRKGELKVMSGIRQNGKALLDDNAADVERVAEWYASAIKEVLPYVGGNHKEFLTMFLAQAADQSDVRKRMELLALVLDDIVGAK